MTAWTKIVAQFACFIALLNTNKTIDSKHKAGDTLAAWRERGVSVACQLRGVCVAFSMFLDTRNVSDVALLLLGDI